MGVNNNTSIGYYDKFIDITLNYTNNVGFSAQFTLNANPVIAPYSNSQTIITPSKGYRPSINISGSFIPNLGTNIEVRILNSMIDFNNNQYQSVAFNCGYRNGSQTGPIVGQILHAYIESPGPDGFTVFFILLAFDELFSIPINLNIQKGSYANILDGFCSSISSAIASSKGVPVNYKASYNSYYNAVFTNHPIYVEGASKDALQTLCNELKISFYIEGNNIRFFDKTYTYSQTPIEITKVSATPRSTVVGEITFQAPWIPTLRPGDLFSINPSFLRQTIGSFNTGSNANSIFQVLNINFDFSTVDSKNTMLVQGLAQ